MPDDAPWDLIEAESSLRSELRARGIGYRLQYAPTPDHGLLDIAFPRHRVGVLVRDCRGAGECAGKGPLSAAADSQAEWRVFTLCLHTDPAAAADFLAEAAPPLKPRARYVSPDGNIEHGTVTSYSNHGCRCAECREANAASQRELIARYREQGGRGRHGTNYRYQTGCRCDRCRAAHAAEDRKWRARRGKR